MVTTTSLMGTLVRYPLILKAATLSWTSGDKVAIRWEIVERETQKVIYSNTFTGQGEAETKSNRVAGYNAVRASLEKVLADDNFVSTLKAWHSHAI